MNKPVQPLVPDHLLPATHSRAWRGYVVALVVFGAIGILLAYGLGLDPKRIPSPLIGRPVPTFELPPVQGRTLGLSSENLTGEVSLVNVFASWCAACLDEHPLFMRLKRDNVVPIHGLNYKDAPDDAAAWLARHGDPYTRTGADRDGRVGIDWGVYGVPETFVIDRDSRIAYKFIGPLSDKDVNETLLPLLEKLRQ
ncbi:MAG TPA: DsbE family thiol:disulfide interchange protein [Burkholderiales bacterium]|jgi:cytochrome c biogenesis protein CcmG/thiol:disulfide interchange protein DsbE